MTWEAWITAVLQIGRGRGLTVTVTRPAPGEAVFTWRDPNGRANGVSGAGASMAAITLPESFTWLWQPDGATRAAGAGATRYVPRVPAMAVSSALEVLFR